MKEKIKELENKYYKTKDELAEILEEYNSYFYSIDLCNSSDFYRGFIKANSEWGFKKYVTILRGDNSDHCLKDVRLKVPKYLISKDDFIKEAKKIVSPLVGTEDFYYFEIKNKQYESKEILRR